MSGGNVVAKAWVEIIPEMSGIREEISKELGAPLEREAKRAGKSAGGGFSSAFKGALGALAGIVAAVGFGDLVSQAAEAADATQKFKSTLDFAGLGQADIEALTKSTRAYADQTVYALSDIQNITAQLAANSVPNFDRLAEAAGNLNAVAGGNAETFQSVGMVLTQTAGAGRLTTENWNQLADAIPGASGRLQEAMRQNGAYTGNFRDAMEAGEISAEEFNEAIMQLGFEDAAVEAAKSTSTFEGAIGNLEAAVVGGLGDILTAAQPALTGIINGITSGVTPAFEALSGWVSTFFSTLQDNGAFSAFASIASSLWDTVSSLASAVGGFVLELLGVPEGASSAESAADGLKGILDALSPIFQGVADAAGFLRDNIEVLTPVIIVLGFALLVVKGALAIQGLVSGFGTAVGKVTPAVSGLGSSMSASVPTILAFAAAVVALGAGIALASAGVWLLAQGAVQLAAGGPAAVAVMLLLVGVVAGLAAGLAFLAPTLTLGAAGMLAFGAAVLMVGAGVLVASAGIALVAAQLPVIAAYGLSGAAALAALGAASLVLGAGVIVAGAGLVVLAAGLIAAGAAMLVASAGLLVLTPAMALAAAGVLALGAGVTVLAAGVTLAAEGVETMGRYLPKVAESAPGAAAGLLELSAAALLAGPGLLVAAPALAALGTAAMAAGTGITASAAGILVLGAGLAVVAAGCLAAVSAMLLVASAAPQATAGLGLLAPAATSAAAGLAPAAPAMQQLASGILVAAMTAAGAASSLSSVGAAGLAVAASLAGAAASALLVGSSFSSLSGTFLATGSSVSSLQSPITSVIRMLEQFAAASESAGGRAANAIRKACSEMSRSVSSMRLTIPRIKVGALPHFRLNGSFNPETGAVPSVSVSWYAKGGYFSGPQVIGIGEGRYDEVALPLSPRVLAGIGEGVAAYGQGDDDVVRRLDRIHRDLAAIYAAIPEGMSKRKAGQFVRKAERYGL